MNLSLYQQTKPVGSNVLVMAISKKTAQDTILHYFELPGPYTGQTQLHTFAGIDNVMWYYQLFESSDGTPTGVVRNYFDVQPNANTYATRDDLYLTSDISDFFASDTAGYGVDPASVDASLVGWNGLEKVGAGTREVDVKYVKTKVVSDALVDTTKDDPEATGWRLLTEGDLIGLNEEWVIHFYPQLQATASPSTSNIISATRILTANTALDNSAIGQAFWLKGASGYFEITLPDGATVPDNEPLHFLSDGGSHVNVGLKCTTGQTIQWYKNASDLADDTRATRIVLGQQQKISLYKFTMDDSSIRWLIMPGWQDRNVGQIITSYSKIPINIIQAAGQLLSRSIYVALWEHVQTLESGALIADSAFDNVSELDGVNWFVNHGKYTTGDGSTTFRVPSLTSGNGFGAGFLRIIDGVTRLPSSFQADAQADHQHEGTAGTLPTSLFGKGATRTKGTYGGQSSGQTDLSGKAGLIVGSTFQQSQKLSYETRSANIGVYGLICV